MLEGQYLEMVNDLKKKFDEKDQEVQNIKDKIKEIKKNFLSCYGFIRIIDQVHNDEFELNGLLEILRAYMSDMYDELNY